MKKRGFALTVFGLLISALFIAPSGVGAEKKPIKIGCLVPRTGTYAEAGRVMEMGYVIALEEFGNKIAGHPLKLIIEDTELKPVVGLSKAKKLVESDNVDFLLGTYSSSVSLTVRDYVDKKGIPLLITGGGVTAALSTTKKSPWVWRGSTVSAQYAIGLASYLRDVLGKKKMVILGPDYSFGREAVKIISNEFEQAGGKVIQKMLTPFPTMDFAPYLSKIKPDADVVSAEYVGSEGVRIVRQYKEFGLWNKWPLVGGAITQDENLPAYGDAGIGIVGSLNYAFNLNTPENNKLIEKMQKKFGEMPGGMTPSAYETTKAALLAAKDLSGDLSDKKAFVDIFRKVEFIGPRGPFKFEQSTHSVVNTVYIRKIIKKNGKYTFKILKVIPDVKPSYVIFLLGK